MQILNVYLNSAQLNFLYRKKYFLWKKHQYPPMIWMWKAEGSFVGQILHSQGQDWKNSNISWANRILIRKAKDVCWEFIPTCLYTKVTKAVKKSQFGPNL